METGKTYLITFNDKSYPNLFSIRMYLTEEYDALRNVSVVKLTRMESKCGHRNGTFYWNGYLNIGGLRVWTGGSTFHSYGYSTGTWAPEEHGDYPYISGEIAHEADGTKSVVVEAVVYGTSSTGFSYSCSISQSIALTEIPRASGVSAPVGVMGQPLNITVTKAAEHFTHTLSYSFGEASGNIAEETGETAIVWTPPVELCTQIPNAVTGDLIITCITYNGTNQIGVSSTICKLTIPDYIIPSATLSVTDAMGYSSTYGTYVQSKSKFKIVISSEGTYGSSIATHRVEVDGCVYNTAAVETDVIRSYGTLVISAIVTDTRGRTVRLETEVDVLAYTRPKITTISASRCNSDGTTNTGGNFIKVVWTSDTTPLNTHNHISYSVMYKKHSEYVYEAETIPDYEGQFYVDNGFIIIPASASFTYDVGIIITDDFTEISKEISVMSGSAFSSRYARGLGAAFGRIAELADYLDVAWNLRVRKNAEIDGTLNAKRIKENGRSLIDATHPIGNVILSANSSNPSYTVGGRWELIGSGNLLSGIETILYAWVRIEDLDENQQYYITDDNKLYITSDGKIYTVMKGV